MIRPVVCLQAFFGTQQAKSPALIITHLPLLLAQTRSLLLPALSLPSTSFSNTGDLELLSVTAAVISQDWGAVR